MPARTPFRIASQAAAGVIVVGALALVAYAVRDILLLVVVAMFLATGLSPAVEWLRRRRVPSVLGLLIVYVVVLGTVVVTVLAAAPRSSARATSCGCNCRGTPGRSCPAARRYGASTSASAWWAASRT